MPSIIIPSRLDLPRNGLVGYYTQRGPGNTGYLDHIAGRVSTFTDNGVNGRSIDRMPKYLVQPVITSGGEHSVQRNARLDEPITIIAYANTYDGSLFVQITDEFFFGLYPYGLGLPTLRRTKSGGGGGISHYVDENWKDKTAVFVVSHSGNLADNAKFYVDGQPKTTSIETSDTGNAAVTTNPVRLTPFKSGWSGAYNAGLPVLAIYNRELLAAEIRALSSKQFPSTLATPRRVLYFETAGGGPTTVTLGQTTETDTAQAITFVPGALAVSLGQAAETDSAQAITAVLGAVSIAISQASETDSAQAIAFVPGAISIALGQAAETDSAQAVTAISGATIATLGQALETDSAQSIIFVPGAISVVLGQAAETDTAQTIAPTIGATVVNIGLVTEIDTAQAIAFVPGAISVAVGQAAETNLAQAITAFYPGETTLTAADLDAIWGYEIEAGITALQAMRILLAFASGKRVGLVVPTGTYVPHTEQYMAQDGIKPRITFTPDDLAGNGTPVVDGS